MSAFRLGVGLFLLAVIAVGRFHPDALCQAASQGSDLADDIWTVVSAERPDNPLPGHLLVPPGGPRSLPPVPPGEAPTVADPLVLVRAG
jgi:hypothetical protein